MGGKDGVASCSREFKYLDLFWKTLTHAATRTPKMRVMIAKSTRSRLDMQASDDSGSCPNMARTKGESDWNFFVAANAAVQKKKSKIELLLAVEVYLLGGVGGASPTRKMSGVTAVDIMARMRICARLETMSRLRGWRQLTHGLSRGSQERAQELPQCISDGIGLNI